MANLGYKGGSLIVEGILKLVAKCKSWKKCSDEIVSQNLKFRCLISTQSN